MDIDYCHKCCEKGKKASEEFLEKNNSVYDAAIEFNFFVETCFNNCPHKEEHIKEKV